MEDEGWFFHGPSTLILLRNIYVVRGLPYMPQCCCCVNSTHTKLMIGDYVAACIYQFTPSIPLINRHVMSDKTYKCPQNNFHLQGREVSDTLAENQTPGSFLREDWP
ncbi:hypothetical protein M433DRAFT_421038 [Acidomyces richmondensis BFW]|nr:hypothetical protein M433DRAFT_421038 [Acidomyces richmondensis BFW]